MVVARRIPGINSSDIWYIMGFDFFAAKSVWECCDKNDVGGALFVQRGI